MSLIVSEVYDALIEAGTSEEKAKAAAGAIPLAERLATKEDLDGLKALFKEDLDGLKALFKEDLDGLKARLQRGPGRAEGRLRRAVCQNRRAVCQNRARPDDAQIRIRPCHFGAAG